MAKMNVRKMKMRCDVKGCKNVDSYCISRSAELGGVVICEDCLRDALAAIENYVEPKKKTDTKPPELFYSGIEDIVSEVSDNDDELSLAGEAAENDTSQKDVPNTENIQNTETDDVLHPVEDGEPNTETDDVLQSVGDGVLDVPNTRTEELTPHPSPDGDTFPSRGRQNDASSKERQKTAATPKRAAKKKTAERGNDK